MQGPAVPSTNAIRQNKTAERRASRQIFSDLQEPQVLVQNRALARRNSLSPLVMAQTSIGSKSFKTGVAQNSVRGGSFRHRDRRLSHQPDVSIGVPLIPSHSGAENMPSSPRASIAGNVMC